MVIRSRYSNYKSDFWSLSKTHPSAIVFNGNKDSEFALKIRMNRSQYNSCGLLLVFDRLPFWMAYQIRSGVTGIAISSIP
jgi:hypothetical protein